MKSKSVSPVEMPKKWFFAPQKKAGDWLKENYDDYSCNYQDITPNRVHENFLCFKDGKASWVHVVMSKTSESDGSVFYYTSI